MSNQKIILISITIFIFFSFSFLAFWEEKQHQIEDGWFLYFNDIDDTSTDFTLENYSKDSEFSFEISLDGNIIKKETVEVLKKDKKNVRLDQHLKGQTIKITVFHSKEKKEIYKNIE